MALTNLLAAFVISVVVHTFGMAVAGWLIGSRIKTVSLFYGPRLFGFTVGNTETSFGLIPAGGFVKFDHSFQYIHPLKRVFVASSGCILLLVVACITLGVSEAFDEFIRGFVEVYFIVVSPIAYGSGLLVSAYEFLRINSFLVCLGLVASKFAAFNLLPVPLLNGSDILLGLVELVAPLSERTRSRIQQIGFVVMLGMLIQLTVAFVYTFRVL